MRGAVKKNLILVAAFAFYLAGYPAVRTERLLVHSTSYFTSDGSPVIAEHGIRPGDFGTPMLGLGTTLATLLASLIYWPITKVEVLYWNIAEPAGSPYDGPVGPPPTYHVVPSGEPADLPSPATPP